VSVTFASVPAMRSAAFRPSSSIRAIMLAAAYAPLLVLLATLNSFQLAWLRWTFAALAAAGIAGLAAFLVAAVPRRNASVERIHTAKPREGEALKFFASYVVPFLVTGSTAAPPARWGLLIYLVMIAVLYVQGDMYFANPVLALLGYRIFELGRSDSGFLLVISRAWHLAPGQTVSLVPLGGYTYVQVKPRREPRPQPELEPV